MAKSCVIKPRVKVGNEIQDSKLYEQMYEYVGKQYNEAWDMYLSAIHSDKIDEAIKSKSIQTNEQGEPSLASLLEKFNFNDVVGKNVVLNAIKNRFHCDEYVATSTSERHKLEEICASINDSIYGHQWIAYINNTDGMYSIELKPNNKSFEAKRLKHDINKQHKIYNLLSQILNDAGIGIDALDNYEERIYNGEIDFTVSERAADGLIHMIRIANGFEGMNALPEEFAHFIIRSMEDNVAVSRCLSYVKSAGLAREILGNEYDAYYEEYNGDEDLLAEEATGKILSKHITKNAEQLVENTTQDGVLKRFISIIWDAAKKLFAKFSDKDIINSMKVLDDTLDSLAKNVLSGDVTLNASVKRAEGIMHQMDNVQQRLQKFRNLFEHMLKNEVKRYNIERNRNSTNAANIKHNIDIMKIQVGLKNELNSICIFMQNAIGECSSLAQNLQNLNNSHADINAKAGAIRSIRNSCYSYLGILSEIRAVVSEEKRYSNSLLPANFESTLNQAILGIDGLLSEANMQGKRILIDLIRPVLGDNVVDPSSGKTYSLDDIASMKVDDMSFLDRWLNSTGEASSYLLKAYDQLYKKQKDNARIKSNMLYKKLASLTQKLKDAGYQNQSFIFERDENGRKTGYYVSELNRGKYAREKKEYYDKLKAALPEHPTQQQLDDVEYKMSLWVEDHTEMTSIGREPKASLYKSSQYGSLNSIQRKYLNDVIDIKRQLDQLLRPGATGLYRTIKIEKDMLERAKSNGVSGAGKTIWDSMKDLLVVRTDDTDAGIRSTITDFEGHEVKDLPIFYTNLREGRNEDDVSEDVVSTLTAYGNMAYEYAELGKIVDAMEVGRSVLRDAGNPYRKGVVERISGVGLSYEDQSRKSDANNLIDRLNDFFDMQVYHQYMADANDTFGKSKISKGKAANLSNAYTSLCQMAFNLLGGISNIVTGAVQMRIETIGGQFMSYGDMMFANKEFMLKLLPEYIGDIGSKYPKSKLALFAEKFNTLQDFEGEIAHKEYDKNIFQKLFRMDSVFFMNNLGEFYMQNKTAIALAHSKNESFKDSSGNPVSLWDAYTPKQLGNNRSEGSELVLKKGLVYKDGRKVVTIQELEERAAKQKLDITDKSLIKDDEISEFDVISKFSRKSAKINHDMHGIYNKDDMNAFQKMGVGRMVIMYRKWIVPSFNRRFRKATYSYDLDSVQEGYYATAWRFLRQVAKDMKAHQIHIIANYKNLQDYEKANMKKFTFEMMFVVVLSTILAALDADDDDDETNEERSYAMRMLEYQARRLYSEIGSMTPGMSMVTESIRIMDSPTANIRTWQRLANFMNMISPEGSELVERGRYEGKTKRYKSFMEIVPFNKTIYRSAHPEDAQKFFTQTFM